MSSRLQRRPAFTIAVVLIAALGVSITMLAFTIVNAAFLRPLPHIRATDELAMIMTFAPQTGRVLFALNQLWNSALPDRKNPSVKVAKIGIQQIAKSAQVREDEVRRVLEIEKVKGNLDYGGRSIRFLRPPKTDEIQPMETKHLT